MHISKFELWSDIGFLEGGVEVPALGDTLPTADFTFESIHSSREDLFTSVKLEHAYSDLISVSYAKITYSDIDYPIFAWIDTVSVLSSTESPVTQLTFHIDLWRTYLSKAKFGSGLVSRRPKSANDPIQNCNPRYRKVSTEVPIIPKPSLTGGFYWVILNAAVEDSKSNEVNSAQLWCPLHPGWAQSVYFQFWGSDADKSPVYATPTWLNWIRGQGADVIGLSAASVSSAFISLLPPGVVLGGVGTKNDPIRLEDTLHTLSPSYDVKGKDGVYMLYRTNFVSYPAISYVVDLETTDTQEVVITDLTGVPIGNVPWGLKVGAVEARPVVSATSAYLELRADGVRSASEGLRWVIPLPPVEVASNSWSDYLYSGQRKFDIEQRRLAAKQALISGIVGVGESTVSAGIMGGIGAGVRGSQASQISDLIKSTKFGGRGAAAKKAQMMSGVSNILGKTGGIGVLGSAGAMLGVSAGSALINYELTNLFNQEFQGTQDQLVAKQLDSIQIPGGGWDWLLNGTPISAYTLIPDEYSLNRFNADISLNGIRCSEPVEDCTELVTVGGPLKIGNLVVSGGIPPQAKAYISLTLEKGVRILIKNKTE